MKKITAYVLSAAVALSGCATASKDVTTTYASPVQFSSYTCEQITAENARLQVRLLQLEGRLDTAATNDKVLTGVALLLFWPAVFALGGTKEQEAEYGRLKGEHDALRQVWLQKNCTINAASLLPGAAATMPLGAAPMEGPSPAPGTTAFGVGDKLTYKTREPVSGADQGESTLTISSIANGEIGFDDGSLVMSTQGALAKGRVSANTLLGVDVSRLYPGTRIQGKFRVVGASTFDNPVDVLVVGSEILEMSGRRFNVVRLEVSGYIKGGGGYNAGTPFSGIVLVEATTGIVISMKIKSQGFAFATDRALVAVVNPAGIPPVAPSAATAGPAPAAPLPSPVVTQAPSREEKLRELKRLYDAGLISAEVYAAQQKTLLGN